MQSEQYVHASDSYAIESSSNTSLADMPPEVRACVLRHLPVGMRLGPCALTCSALSAAAVAATDVLCMHSIYQQKASALAAWIAKHGATLVHLELKDCTAVNFDCGMGHLASLTALQRLELQAAFNNAYAALGGEAAYGAALSSTTGQLQQLTALELSTLHRHSLPAYALAGLSKLTRLRQLKLHCFRSAAKPVSLQGLPSSVTQLHLSDTAATVSDALGSSSGKPLPDLQDLQLEMCAVIEVAAVAHFSHLKRLSCVGGSRFTTPELLAVLPRLQQLQVLSLDSFDDDDAVTAADYAALTASSNLVSLQLVCCSIPQAALQHMFAPGRRLPHLRCLNVSLAGGGEPVTPCWWVSDALLMDNLLFTPGDAQRLVECCPALQELGCVTLCHGASSSLLVPLLQLSKLTSLLIGGTMCGDAEAAKLLAKFTGLQRLSVWCGKQFTGRGLAHLTRLTALGALSVCSYINYDASEASDEDDDEDDDDNWHDVRLTQGEESGPAVWQQLQQLCMEDPAALAVMYEQAQQQLQQAQQQLASERQQHALWLAAGEARIADLERQLAQQALADTQL